MNRILRALRVVVWKGMMMGFLAGACLFQGCPLGINNSVDNDLLLQAMLSFAVESTAFLLDNLVRGV